MRAALPYRATPSLGTRSSMAMLSLSFSFIHLEFSAAKSPKEHALVLSMISFSARQKNDRTVHNASGTRLLLLSSRSVFGGLPRVSTASSRCQSDCTFQMIARAARVHSASDAKTANDSWRRNPTFDYTFDIPVEVAAAVCKYRHDRWKIEWDKPQFTWLDVAIGSKPALTAPKRDFRNAPRSRHSQGQSACLKGAIRDHTCSMIGANRKTASRGGPSST